MAKIIAATLRQLVLPLHTPYRLSYRTFTEFEPHLISITDDEGRTGISDSHISPGSSTETREGGWQFCHENLKWMIGKDISEAKQTILSRMQESKVAATGLVTAIEVMERHSLLNIPEDVKLPLLTPTNADDAASIKTEVERRLSEGYRCLKIKVGKDVEADLVRVAHYQDAIAGRGTLRIDANRAYSQADGERFASSLRPEAIELFEQPCAAEDWDANAAVAAVSTVPLMLDEPICAIEDIKRAGTMAGVGFCKLKLKRFGSLEKLAKGLKTVRECGMEPVLGDGLGSDLHVWLEACVARTHITNAGEFNGFLKCNDRILAAPPEFQNGSIEFSKGSYPELDLEAVSRLTRQTLEFGSLD